MNPPVKPLRRRIPSASSRVAAACAGSCLAVAAGAAGLVVAPRTVKAEPRAATTERALPEAPEWLAKLARYRDEARRARGPEAYVALRRLWREWDQGDPSAVEEAIDVVATDPAAPAPVRAYAGLLEAYARRRRGDLDGAKARVAALGYVGRWLMVGPFDNEGKGGFDRSFGPEDDRAEPITLTRSYDGKERPVRWRVAPAVSPFAWFDIGVFMRPAEKACGYAATFVRDARTEKQKVAARPISLWAGSAGAVKVWWNGQEVMKDDKYRALDSERLASSVVLSPGYNRLLVKVCGDEDGTMLSLRLAGPDGSPDPNLEVDENPSRGIEGDLSPSKRKLPPPAAVPAGVPRVEGALQAFERRARGNDPAALEAYARYLALTQGDDPSERRARELARKAATLAPTIPRLLLAGELAEGRNQRASWIEKAEVRSRAGQASASEAIDVLLARAAHARGGENFRDAIPFYDRVLAERPDDITASLARFELYGEAGLRETARAFLEQKLDQRPLSVALVRAMASAFREEDRTTEADEMENRYAALRFDDPAIARSRIELAVARRDTAAANAWVERLLATNPDSAGALGVAARAFLQLGDRPRAIAMEKRALDLAPEDTDTMRQLADTYGLTSRPDEQLRLLRRILELKPQDKDVRDYVAHSEPSKPRPDEAYARPSSEFLAKRGAKPNGENRRTLVDLQVTTVFPNGLASRFHQVVFQPLTESAAAEAREYAFGFEADTEAVQLRGARVYREGNKVDEAIESGEGAADNPSLSTYTSARAYYVHFPRLHAGDVVELQYRVEDVAPRNAFADYFGEVNTMQSSEPLARAEYVLITPKSRTFYFNKPKVPGLQQTTSEDATTRTYRFVALDVPPIVPEALQPPWSEILGHVHVSTYKSWDDMGQWYWGLVKDQFVADDEVRRRVAEVTKGLTTEKAKVQAVYDYVVQKTRYVALEFGIHGFKPYRCAQIFARGFGDCKDKATLIVTMLKELGIPATIVIVRTGNRGDFETDPASLAPFDHAIAYVPSLDTYLDGTAEWTGSNELPAMDRGALALQVNEGKPKLVHLPDPPASESVTTTRVVATLADREAPGRANATVDLDWRTEVTGVSAPGFRARYHAEATRKLRLQEDLGGSFGGAEVTDFDTGNLEDLERPVTLHARARSARFGRSDGDSLSLPVGPQEHAVRDLAPLSQRHQDVRLHAQNTSVHDWTIKLPPSAKVASAPTGSEVNSPFGHFKMDVDARGSVVHVTSTFAITKTRIAEGEYPAFRGFCEQVDRALGQRLIVNR